LRQQKVDAFTCDRFSLQSSTAVKIGTLEARHALPGLTGRESVVPGLMRTDRACPMPIAKSANNTGRMPKGASLRFAGDAADNFEWSSIFTTAKAQASRFRNHSVARRMRSSNDSPRDFALLGGAAGVAGCGARAGDGDSRSFWSPSRRTPALSRISAGKGRRITAFIEDGMSRSKFVWSKTIPNDSLIGQPICTSGRSRIATLGGRRRLAPSGRRAQASDSMRGTPPDVVRSWFVASLTVRAGMRPASAGLAARRGQEHELLRM